MASKQIAISPTNIVKRGLCGIISGDESRLYRVYCEDVSCRDCMFGDDSTTTEEDILNFMKKENIIIK